MKKTIIGSIVGALILFMWQFLSWTTLDLHRPMQEYTPKQDSILAFLSANLDKEGGYYMPGVPKGTSFEEMEKLTAASVGKPWVSIQYHHALEYNMGLSMTRGFLVDVLLVWMLIWILGKFAKNDFTTSFFASLILGIFAYLSSNYTLHIWYPLFDIRAYLIDAVVAWGLTGIWLGWWLNRKKA
ncbi:MAG: hypothetical protein I8H66_04525 [Sphingobacteriia bacterium]|nr:hypothetical protein [Sphingobacteriia bacterium]